MIEYAIAGGLSAIPTAAVSMYCIQTFFENLHLKKTSDPNGTC
jgi:hypothetical protein